MTQAEDAAPPDAAKPAEKFFVQPSKLGLAEK